jgi:hypothetical protein
MTPWKPSLARLSLVFAVVLAACGAGQAAPPPATLPGAAAPLTAASPATCPTAIPSVDRPHDSAWATWTHEQKLAYMKEAVLPTETPLFREYSPTRFAELTCRTCHRAGADSGRYTLPNPERPKRAKGHLFELEKTKPRVFRFMYDVVTPRTAALLNIPEWSHKTMSGFGCFSCHPLADEDSKPSP